jgi:hypothetical protein
LLAQNDPLQREQEEGNDNQRISDGAATGNQFVHKYVKRLGKSKGFGYAGQWQSILIKSFPVSWEFGCDATKNSLDADQSSVNRLPQSRIKGSTQVT